MRACRGSIAVSRPGLRPGIRACRAHGEVHLVVAVTMCPVRSLSRSAHAAARRSPTLAPRDSVSGSVGRGRACRAAVAWTARLTAHAAGGAVGASRGADSSRPHLESQATRAPHPGPTRSTTPAKDPIPRGVVARGHQAERCLGLVPGTFVARGHQAERCLGLVPGTFVARGHQADWCLGLVPGTFVARGHPADWRVRRLRRRSVGMRAVDRRSRAASGRRMLPSTRMTLSESRARDTRLAPAAWDPCH
jgi:hypothetical protein